MEVQMEGFFSSFSIISDPRAANAQHDLMEVLFVALAAVLCGAKTCTEMALFGRSKEEALREVLELPHGIPSHDTFSSVFRRLDPAGFETAFRRFADAFRTGLPPGIIAVDGKVLRRAFIKGKRHAPQVMVSAWGAEMRMVLGSRAAPEGNEIKAVIELLQLVNIKGALVTADALHCHPAMAQTVTGHGADYVLCLKNNHKPLLDETEKFLSVTGLPQAETIEAAHGRKDIRRAVVAPLPVELAEKYKFPKLCAIGRIESIRETETGKKETAVRHFVLSRLLSPTELLHVVRTHWTIENSLHWVLDVVLDEDLARTRRDHGAKNLATLRRLALNIVRADESKGSIAGKIKQAGWNNTFLFKLLAHMR
jgi:predicted transposase YbfD/YdcC